jgi:hypothetical protein
MWPNKMSLSLQIALKEGIGGEREGDFRGNSTKCDFIWFIRLFRRFLRALKDVYFFRVTAVFEWSNWIYLLYHIEDWSHTECRWRCSSIISRGIFITFRNNLNEFWGIFGFHHGYYYQCGSWSTQVPFAKHMDWGVVVSRVTSFTGTCSRVKLD